MELPDKILERLQKLLEREERPGSVEEAAVTTALINNLLIKYNMSRTDAINNLQEKSNDNVIYIQGKYADYQTPYDGGFVKSLMNTISQFNFCKMVNMTGKDDKGTTKNFGFTVLGKKYNLRVCMYMFDYCLNNIKILFNEHYVTHGIPYKKGSHKLNAYRRGFYEGAVIAIHNRLLEQREQAKTDFQPKKQTQQPYNDIHEEDDFNMNSNVSNPDEPQTKQIPQENALMVLIKETQEELDKAAEKLFDNLKKGRSSTGSRDDKAKYYGYEAGKKLELHKGLEATNNMKQELLLLT